MADRFWIGGASGATGDWGNTANWAGGVVPTTSDNVYIGVNNQDTLYDIDASLNQSGVVLGQVWIFQSFNKLIGTTAAFLQLRCTGLHIGYPSAQAAEEGSKRVKIQLDSNTACDVHVYNSAPDGEDAGREPVQISTDSASGAHTFSISGGIIGLASLGIAGEYLNATSISITPDGASQPRVTMGQTATVTTINQSRGEFVNQGANITTLNLEGGDHYALSDCTYTTINCRGGTCHYYSDGTITTLNLSKAGVWETAEDSRTKTITTAKFFSGGTLNTRTANPMSVTITNPVELTQCGYSDVQADFGDHIKLTVAAI